MGGAGYCKRDLKVVEDCGGPFEQNDARSGAGFFGTDFVEAW